MADKLEFVDSEEGYIYSQILAYQGSGLDLGHEVKDHSLIPFGVTKDEVLKRHRVLSWRIKKCAMAVWIVVWTSLFINMFLNETHERYSQVAMGVFVVISGFFSLRWCQELMNIIIDPAPRNEFGRIYLWRAIQAELQKRLDNGALSLKKANAHLRGVYEKIYANNFDEWAIAELSKLREFTPRGAPEFKDSSPINHSQLGDTDLFVKDGHRVAIMYPEDWYRAASASTCCGAELYFDHAIGRITCKECAALYSGPVVTVKKVEELERFFEVYFQADPLESYVCANAVFDTAV